MKLGRLRPRILSAYAAPQPAPENVVFENIIDNSGSILPFHESFELNGDSTPHYDVPFYSRNTWRYDWTVEQIGKSDVPATGPRKASDGIAYTYLETYPGGAFTRGNKAIYQISLLQKHPLFLILLMTLLTNQVEKKLMKQKMMKL